MTQEHNNEEFIDEWQFQQVLSQYGIDDENLLTSLNNHMDSWATQYTNKRDTAKKAAYNEMLCCALQLSIKGRKQGEKDILLEEWIEILQECIKEEEGDDE